MNTATVVCRTAQARTITDTGAEKSARVATLLSVPDFCFSADIIRATYDADVSIDGVWSCILDSVDADIDLARTVEALL